MLFLQLVMILIITIDALTHPHLIKLSPAKSWLDSKILILRNHFRSPYGSLTLITTLLLLLTSMGIRYYTPISDFDDKMYRASTPLYWTQNKSIFRFPTANERKNVFLMGTGFINLWPSLFQLSEQNTRVFYWLGYPLLVIYLLAFAYVFSKNVTLSATIGLLFTSTPIVSSYFTHTMIQESWGAIVLLCYGYFLFASVRVHEPSMLQKLLFSLGLTAGLLPFMKLSFAYFLIPIIASLFIYHRHVRRIVMITVGLLISIILSGYLFLSVQNFGLYGSPFGTIEFQRTHRSELSLSQIRTNSSRFIALLFEFPWFSSYITKRYTETTLPIATFLGANTPLSMENEDDWIGQYAYSLASPNQNFSLGGILWLAIIFLTIVHIVLGYKTHSLSKERVVTFFFILAVFVFVVDSRWAEGSNIPCRHLISAYALFIGCSVFYANQLLFLYRRGVGILFLVLLFFSSSQLFLSNMNILDSWWNQDLITTNSHRFVNMWPYPDSLLINATPTTYLLVESQDSNDYPLFWYDGYQHNTVHLISGDEDQPLEKLALTIKQRALKTGSSHIILYDQSNELAQILEKEMPDSTIDVPPSDVSLTIVQLKLR